MNKIKLLTAAALVSVVTFAPAVIADEIKLNTITVVNSVCVTDNQKATELRCYMSSEPISMKAGDHIQHSPVKTVKRANPGIESYIVDGYLPAFHMIATTTSS